MVIPEESTNDGTERWKDIVMRLDPMLQELLDAPSARRLDHRPTLPSAAGIYLFLNDNWPLYVGQTRNLRRRLADHCRASSGHNQASFAFNIARRSLSAKGVQLPRGRSEIEALPEFSERFKQAKAEVDGMEVRYIKCDDAEVRTVFEVFAAVHLGTPYNTFETH
jgi:hypothetical protein